MDNQEEEQFIKLLDDAIVSGDVDIFNQAINLISRYDNYNMEQYLVEAMIDTLIQLYDCKFQYCEEMFDILAEYLSYLKKLNATMIVG